MNKWADYLIIKVRYVQNGNQAIEKVKTIEDKGDKLGNKIVFPKNEVINKIEGGITFCTAKKNDQGKYNRGSDVHVVTVNGRKYIRTDRNDTPEDNLGELPEF